MPDEDKTFSGSFVLDLRIWWRQAHTLYRTKWLSRNSAEKDGEIENINVPIEPSTALQVK